MTKIDFNNARSVLENALKGTVDRSMVSADELADVEWIIKNNHLTYRYILVNALLGRSCADINPLVLQKSSNSAKSWDARSLCHKVLVPFEKNTLEQKMGGSNEPFLNKPARFTDLSKDNAVRAGNDKAILLRLIALLSGINSTKKAFSLLTHSLKVVNSMSTNVLKVGVVNDRFLKRESLVDFLSQLLSEKNEGQSLAFSISLALRLAYLNQNCIVCSHPTNQSGASSKEISDIDLMTSEKTIFGCFEIKDKNFNATDVNHAIQKVTINNLNNLVFIYTKDTFNGDADEIRREVSSQNQNFDFVLIEASDFLLGVSTMFLNVTAEELIGQINLITSEMRPNKVFVDRLKTTYDDFFKTI